MKVLIWYPIYQNVLYFNKRLLIIDKVGLIFRRSTSTNTINSTEWKLIRIIRVITKVLETLRPIIYIRSLSDDFQNRAVLINSIYKIFSAKSTNRWGCKKSFKLSMWTVVHIDFPAWKSIWKYRLCNMHSPTCKYVHLTGGLVSYQEVSVNW